MAEVPNLSSFVGGAFRPSTHAGWVDDVNPSDASDVIARVPAGDPSDVDAAVEAAAAALPSWRARTGPQRAESLWTWSEAIAARREEIAQAMTREVGKPISEARGEAARCVAILRYFAGEAVREIGETLRSIHKLADNLDKRTEEITKGVNLFTAAGTKQINIIGADAHKTLTQVELTFKNLDKNPSRLLFGGTAEPKR